MAMTPEQLEAAAQLALLSIQKAREAQRFLDTMTAKAAAGGSITGVTYSWNDGTTASASLPLTNDQSAAVATQTEAFVAPVILAETAAAAALIVNGA